MVRNGSTRESEIQMTDGRRLLKLHYRGSYGEAAAAAAAVECEVFPRRTIIASFLREFGLDGTSKRHFSQDLCVNVDHILDEVGGSIVDPADWNIRSISVRTLRDVVRQNCGGDQTLADVFMQKLGMNYEWYMAYIFFI